MCMSGQGWVPLQEESERHQPRRGTGKIQFRILGLVSWPSVIRHQCYEIGLAQ